MKKLWLLWLCVANITTAQINFNANEIVPEYTESFGFGVNPGYNINWSDEQLADISAGNTTLTIPGVGINTFRPTLPESFLEEWGYEIRLSTFQHYEDLGMRDHTVFIGYPSDEHRDTMHFCPEHQSNLFLNMYEPIWDNGANGTPVNEENYYASYVYQMVNIYKDFVGFWEVWNEPDFDYSGNGWKPPGMTGNWWENVPEPCDYKLRAPVFHYIRLLRISYEVIKFIDPEAYVAIGGIGYPSFLDIVLRFSDNPAGGMLNTEFPLTGGAYFDALSYHSYPHFDGSLRYWSNDAGGFVYTRHSDAAAQGVLSRKDALMEVLNTYGYEGNTFPEKKWIITESNLPAKSFNPEYLGSDEVARNFIIKTIVQCQKNDILQFHVYKLGDSETCDQADYEFEQMGLYEKLSGIQPYSQTVKDEGIALKTISDAIDGAFYDPVQTAVLQLPATIDGGAFQHPDGSYTYVLWAITETDLSEEATAVYNFPSTMNINLLEKRSWNFSQTGIFAETLPENIELSGSPFILNDISSFSTVPEANFAYILNSDCAPFTVQFNDLSNNLPTQWSWSFTGGIPASSTLQNPSVTFENNGFYTISLIVSNSFGSDENTLNIDLGTQLETSFSQQLCFGQSILINGSVYDESNPTGTEIFVGGSYQGCDSIVHIELEFAGSVSSEISTGICPGGFYIFDGNIFDTAGTYSFEFTGSGGCDSIVTLYLEEFEDYFITLNDTILPDESYLVGSSVYTEPGMYQDTLNSINSCDSIIALNLVVDNINAVQRPENLENIDFQCFPNPFSKVVSFNFVLPQAEEITISILNIYGETIQVLQTRTVLPNGTYAYRFEKGKFPAGIYFCNFTINKQNHILKLVCL